MPVCWYLDFVSLPDGPSKWVYRYFCFRSHLFETAVVVVHTSWTDVILWLNWSFQIWREKLGSHNNNNALSSNNIPYFLMLFIGSFCLRAKFNHSLWYVDLCFHYILYLVFFYSTCCAAFCVIFSSADTGCWINIARYLLFLCFE